MTTKEVEAWRVRSKGLIEANVKRVVAYLQSHPENIEEEKARCHSALETFRSFPLNSISSLAVKSAYESILLEIEAFEASSNVVSNRLAQFRLRYCGSASAYYEDPETEEGSISTPVERVDPAADGIALLSEGESTCSSTS